MRVFYVHNIDSYVIVACNVNASVKAVNIYDAALFCKYVIYKITSLESQYASDSMRKFFLSAAAPEFRLSASSRCFIKDTCSLTAIYPPFLCL